MLAERPVTLSPCKTGTTVKLQEVAVDGSTLQCRKLSLISWRSHSKRKVKHSNLRKIHPSGEEDFSPPYNV